MDYPPIPPGVKIFDPRRLRRAHRRAFLLSERQRLTDQKRIDDAEKRALLRSLHSEQQKRSRLEEEKRAGVLGKLRRFFSRARKS